MEIEDIKVFIGIDVGKAEHWTTALDRNGERLLDKALPNDEAHLREIYEHLGKSSTVLFVVD